jgi:putative transposase
LDENYRGRRRVFFTFCCDHRRPYFSNATSAEWVLQKLFERAQAHSSLAHAWCVMPDHMHAFIEGISETCDALRFAHDFKQRTGFEWKSNHKNRLWQPRFYDHIVRSSVATERIVFYIWSNPVRKGMCTEFSRISVFGLGNCAIQEAKQRDDLDPSVAGGSNFQVNPCRSEDRRYKTLRRSERIRQRLQKAEID